MKKFGIVFGCLVMFGCMLTATFVFADVKEETVRKSYYVENEESNPAIEHNLELVTKLEKKVTNNRNQFNYSLEIVDGNVILTSLLNGSKEAVYSKGDAKYLTEVNFYYYDASFLLLITEDGSLYSNIYTSNDYRFKFRKIKTDNSVESLKVVETEQRFYEYPKVELYGVNKDNNTELIRL